MTGSSSERTAGVWVGGWPGLVTNAANGPRGRPGRGGTTTTTEARRQQPLPTRIRPPPLPLLVSFVPEEINRTGNLSNANNALFLRFHRTPPRAHTRAQLFSSSLSLTLSLFLSLSFSFSPVTRFIFIFSHRTRPTHARFAFPFEFSRFDDDEFYLFTGAVWTAARFRNDPPDDRRANRGRPHALGSQRILVVSFSIVIPRRSFFK